MREICADLQDSLIIAIKMKLVLTSMALVFSFECECGTIQATINIFTVPSGANLHTE